jgi:hypothetical protein
MAMYRPRYLAGPLSEALADTPVVVIVLCTAPEPRHLGGRLWILPISALWQPSAL